MGTASSLGQKGGENTDINENRIPVFQELASQSLMFLRRIHVIQEIQEIEEI